jgi:hypothetical protein
MSPQKFLDISPSLNPEDIANGVLYVLGAPPHVQVCSAFSILILILHAMESCKNALYTSKIMQFDKPRL